MNASTVNVPVHAFGGVHWCPFLSYIYIGMELQDYKVHPYLALEDTAKHFLKVIVAFFTPTSKV